MKVNEMNGNFVRLASSLPATEATVYNVLLKKGELHAPAISRASNGTVSIASVYVILSRLEKKGMVSKREQFIEIDDTKVRRVYYQVIGANNPH